MNLKVFACGCAVATLFAASLSAQVPQMLSYQGRVTVGGTNFTGVGHFKFAMVDGGVTNIGAQATAQANVSSGHIVSISVIKGGSNYVTAPSVNITDSTGSGASAFTLISGGVVTSVLVQSQGQNYSSSPVVTIAPPPTTVFQTFWSSDGTSSFGSEPASSIPLAVSGGLFRVLLGDTTLSNMVSVPPTVFVNPDVRVRVWFDDGVNGSSQLAPDQRIAAVGYAMIAANVSDGAITSAKLATGAVSAGKLAANAVLAGNIAANAINSAQLTNGAVTAAQIASGAVGTVQLADGSVTSSKLAASAVLAGDLGPSAVQGTNIANAAVGTNQLATNSVITAKLADQAVTSAKLADAAVISAKLATQAVQTTNIANGAVGAAQLASDAIGGVAQVIRGVAFFSGSAYQTNVIFSPAIDPTKSYVFLSEPVLYGSTGGGVLSSDKSALIALGTTNITIAVDYGGSSLQPVRVSYQIVQSK